MSKIETLNPIARSICETGAQAGEVVRCVSSNDPRYTKGKTYAVVLHFGRAHILSGNPILPNDKEVRRGVQPYFIPVEGYGATWQRVQNES